jgi:D-alanyl-lipoteichoic acid acyltransferase DltB (MBOAT superfamily)
MLFPTFDFLLFAIPVLAGFWAMADRPLLRTVFLLAASYFFYMAGPATDPPGAPWYFVGLLLLSTVLDFTCGHAIHRLDPAAESEDPLVAAAAKRRRNLWLSASLVGNLGLLGYFKYANFFMAAFADMAGAVGISIEAYHLDVILPLGISFYTFQSLSYTLDVWRGRLVPEPSFLRFALFVSFFPQLVAGPIVRASQFLPQLQAGPKFSREGFEKGAWRVCKGLAKKVVLGDFIAVHLTDRIFDNPEMFTSAELLVALYGYTLQIYADFSGYSDIAIGMGLMLGFVLPENFDRPYQSRDIAEYWRRWHMTLSSWLRDYLFFQLLARFGARAGYVAVWLTMFLVGMWHGASWNFVIYANIHAGAMVFNRWNRMRRTRRGPGPSKAVRATIWALGSAASFAAFAALGRYLFRLEWEGAAILASFITGFGLVICALPLSKMRDGRLKTFVHILLTFHLLVLSRIFFRAPDLDTARAFVAGLVRFDGRGLRPDLASEWIWLCLVLGLAYHFTPKKWVDEVAYGVFRRIPGPLLGVLFLAFAYGLMKVLEGAPRAFIYFQF